MSLRYVTPALPSTPLIARHDRSIAWYDYDELGSSSFLRPRSLMNRVSWQHAHLRRYAAESSGAYRSVISCSSRNGYGQTYWTRCISPCLSVWLLPHPAASLPLLPPHLSTRCFGVKVDAWTSMKLLGRGPWIGIPPRCTVPLRPRASQIPIGLDRTRGDDEGIRGKRRARGLEEVSPRPTYILLDPPLQTSLPFSDVLASACVLARFQVPSPLLPID